MASFEKWRSKGHSMNNTMGEAERQRRRQRRPRFLVGAARRLGMVGRFCSSTAGATATTGAPHETAIRLFT
ncbi:unnamed protein product [Nippostrongylus brasiliensis]|uniref:Uncharacterized protein n=1 Tax=Nippostrongylus brasiliensis TaxID=27835 RepID=A0A0N4Y087_NIPBR|nr:unnamed protein product [Nippostrongylus brasiliensis]